MLNSEPSSTSTHDHSSWTVARSRPEEVRSLGKLRLLHVTHQYWPAIGGSEQYMASISEELAARGHTVDVLTTRSQEIQSWRSQLPRYQEHNGVRIHRSWSIPRSWISWRLLELANRNKDNVKARWVEPLFLAGYGPLAPGIASHILSRGRHYDLIHIQTLPFSQVVYGFHCARAIKKPLVITPHIHIEQPDVFDRESFNNLLRRADMVFAVSDPEAKYVTKRGVDPGSVRTIGNGIRLVNYPRIDFRESRARLGLPPDAFITLFLGRNEPYKGLSDLIKACLHLESHFPDLYLATAGPEGKHSNHTDNVVRNFPRQVDFGLVSDSTKLDLLNACDVMVLPSTGEAFGIVFLEAWAVGKPVIGARVGAVKSIIEHGHDGLLVSPHDPEDLARALSQLITDSRFSRKLGRSGYAKVKSRFTVARITDRVEEGYQSLMSSYANTVSY